MVTDSLADMPTGDRIRGVNINYLTFPEIKYLLQYCNNAGFVYQSFMNNKRITDSFRTYLSGGIKMIRKLDCQFIAKVMSIISPTFDPAEVEAIRQAIHEQVAQQVNPPTPMPGESMSPPGPAPGPPGPPGPGPAPGGEV
jgi:hypothetical protein